MRMKASEETKKLAEKINSHSGNRLKNITDVALILETTSELGRSDLFNDLIFKAKYIRGLKSVLSNRIVVGDDFMEKMFKEFNDNLQMFVAVLKDLIHTDSESNREHFKEKYFGLKQENIISIMSLIEDLAVCKEFFNQNPGEALKNKSGT